MPRIILDYNKTRYALWCKKVPPITGGKRGELIFQNVERKKYKDDYLVFLRVKKTDEVQPSDILIELKTDPTSGILSLPIDGSNLTSEIRIKLGISSQSTTLLGGKDDDKDNQDNQELLIGKGINNSSEYNSKMIKG